MTEHSPVVVHRQKWFDAGTSGLRIAFKVISPFFVCVLLMLVGGAVYEWFDLIIPMWTNFMSPAYCLFTSIGLFLGINVLWHYSMCVLVSPGLAPFADHLDCEAEDYHYCKQCKRPTPEETQHCFICGECVYDLDHHCPWIMNCVGRNNHKHFFLFLFYVTLSCIYYCFFSIPPFYTVTYKHRHFSKTQPKQYDHGMLSLSAILPMTLSIAVGGMMLWHAYLLATCQTSPEFAHNFFKKYQAYKRGSSWTHEKDQGFVKNWKVRFGLERSSLWWILWAFPFLYKPTSGGHAYSAVRHHDV
jgi:hypothetical protein